MSNKTAKWVREKLDEHNGNFNQKLKVQSKRTQITNVAEDVGKREPHTLLGMEIGVAAVGEQHRCS